jgi:hypothetical protein
LDCHRTFLTRSGPSIMAEFLALRGFPRFRRPAWRACKSLSPKVAGAFGWTPNTGISSSSTRRWMAEKSPGWRTCWASHALPAAPAGNVAAGDAAPGHDLALESKATDIARSAASPRSVRIERGIAYHRRRGSKSALATGGCCTTA